jgi:hypothetical protein
MFSEVILTLDTQDEKELPNKVFTVRFLVRKVYSVVRCLHCDISFPRQTQMWVLATLLSGMVFVMSKKCAVRCTQDTRCTTTGLSCDRTIVECWNAHTQVENCDMNEYQQRITLINVIHTLLFDDCLTDKSSVTWYLSM